MRRGRRCGHARCRRRHRAARRNAGRHRRRRHSARPARHRRERRRADDRRRHLLADDGGDLGAARRPGAAAAHPVPRRPRQLDGRGHRVPVGTRDALVPRRHVPGCRRPGPCDREVRVRRDGEWAAEVPVGANGVVATMANVMQADAWHHAAPAFVGFDINDAARSSRGAFIRAIEESAAIVASAHLDILAALTDRRAVAEGTVTFTGGSSAGALWPRVIAGVTGLDTRVTPAPEATSYGAARLAARGVGAVLPPMGDPDRVERVDRVEYEQYRTVTERWHRVYRDVLSISGSDLPPLFTPPGAARGPHDHSPTRLTPVGHGR
ncbi:FGGY-family carbohydrate kinase [Microbacterium sp. NPDC028030]|uniref:FGGY-family carbohydrate kinase n=1 Tax=Microbacterium sp. NPDC028030 TaxID=3155124 RepID=UPI0033C84A47